MNYLLDTYTALWFFDEVEKLSETALEVILSREDDKYISIVSAWEIAIKISRERMQFDGGISEFFNIIDKNGFHLLPILEKHVTLVATLPFLHRDPFDRILVATAKTEGMCLITADKDICLYDVACLW